MRSADGGASWDRLPARRWSGTQVAVSDAGDGDVLVSAAEDGIQVSRDGGLSFQAFDSPIGQIDVRPLEGEEVAVLISGDQGQHLLNLPEGSVRRVPGTTLESAQLVFHPAWPKVPPGQPAALASAAHPGTGLPVVQRCDASFSCTGGTVVSTEVGVAKLYVSPRFGRDGTVFAAPNRGGLFRSTDGARTFRPVTVTPATKRQLISTVQALSFDGGDVFAGLLTVSGKSGGSGKLAGGVYRSDDGGVTWSKVGGASDLDRGVTAVAAAGDRLLAAPMGAFEAPAAPVLCSVGDEGWRTSCPAAAGEASAGEVAARGAGGHRPGGDGGAGRGTKGGRGNRQDRDRGPSESDTTRAAGDSSAASRGVVAALAVGALVLALAALRSLKRS